MNKIIKTLLVGISVLVSMPSQAIILSDSAEIHGFVSQGYIYSPDNPYAGTDSKTGSYNFREIALNGFWEVNDRFRVAGQVLSLRMDEADDGEPRIDFLLADYLAVSNEDATFGIRLGRIKNPLGIYNSTRDIPSARPGMNVPSSIYFSSFRDSILATDGLNLYGSFASDVGVLAWEGYAGSREMKDEAMEYYLYGQPNEGDFEEVALKGLKLSFVPQSQHDLSFGLSFLQVNTKLENAMSVIDAGTAYMIDSMTPGVIIDETNYITGTELDSLFALFSVQYGVADWLFSAEYHNIFSDFNIEIAGMTQKLNSTSEGYYLQAEWFGDANWHALLRYEELFLDDTDRSGEGNAPASDPYHGYGKGLTLGVKWLINSDVSLTGQVSRNEGTAWLPSFDGVEQEVIRKYWDTYALQLSYQF